MPASPLEFIVRRLTLGIDIDNVIRDFQGALQQCWEQETGEWVPRARVQTWGLRDTFRHPTVDPYVLFRDTHAACIFRDAAPVPGAVAAVTYLAEQHRIILVSTNNHTLPQQYTLAWLARFKVPYDDLVFTDEKERVSGIDLFIDDGPPNLCRFIQAGSPYLIFDQPYNRDIPGPRAYCWAEVERYVLSIALRA